MVVGLGYVGLPLANLAARHKLSTLGVDVDERKVLTLSRELGIPITQVPEPQSWFEQSTLSSQALVFFKLHESTSASSQTTYVVTVDTPLAHDKPDLRNLLQAASWVGEVVRNNDLVVIESTVAPGTTRQQVADCILAKSGLEAGRDFMLAFSPERSDPGNQLWTVANTPKLVAGLTASCLRAARSFYESIGISVIEVPSMEVAEMAKLMENSYRAVNVAFANEMQNVCEAMGLDWEEVFDAASTKPFGFMSFYPSTGVGGHCIPVDPVYLIDALKRASSECDAPVLELSVNRNKARAYEIGKIVLDHLHSICKDVSRSSVLIVGMGYKSGSTDLRNAPAIGIAQVLRESGVKVYSTEVVSELARLGITPLSSESIESTNFDLVVATSSAEPEVIDKLRKKGLTVFRPLKPE